MTEIREIDGERMIVTVRGNEQHIQSLPLNADDELVTHLLAAAIRHDRDTMLVACDYLMMPDYPTDEIMMTAWRAYRQALRDIPGQEGFPHVVDWPVSPSQLPHG